MNSKPDGAADDASEPSVASADERDDEHDDTNDNDSGNDAEDDGGFGDDFDDFEEGGEGDDFGDFDDGFQGGEEAETTFSKPPDEPSVPVPSPGPVSLRYSIPHCYCFECLHNAL